MAETAKVAPAAETKAEEEEPNIWEARAAGGAREKDYSRNT